MGEHSRTKYRDDYMALGKAYGLILRTTIVSDPWVLFKLKD